MHSRDLSDQAHTERTRGVIAAAGSFFFWGVVPIYWKQMQGIAAIELIAHRIVWSLLFLVGVLWYQKNLAKLRPVVRRSGTWIMLDDDRFPLNPGEKPEMRMVRFRTLGCYPLSGAVESTAATLSEIIAEMRSARTSEREGRLIDTDEEVSMEKKKREGYF